jgi:hypothetical protein
LRGRPERVCKKKRSAWGTGRLRFFMRIAVKAVVDASGEEKLLKVMWFVGFRL